MIIAKFINGIEAPHRGYPSEPTGVPDRPADDPNVAQWNFDILDPVAGSPDQNNPGIAVGKKFERPGDQTDAVKNHENAGRRGRPSFGVDQQLVAGTQNWLHGITIDLNNPKRFRVSLQGMPDPSERKAPSDRPLFWLDRVCSLGKIGCPKFRHGDLVIVRATRPTAAADIWRIRMRIEWGWKRRQIP